MGERKDRQKMTYPNWFIQGGAQHNFAKHLSEFMSKPMSALQIGAYTGDATVWLFENIIGHNEESSLVDVDTWEGSEEPEHAQMNWQSVEMIYDARTAKFGKRLCKNKMTSDEFFESNSAVYDFIYVDGDHTAASVLKDGISAVKFIAPGGIIAFDDYLWRSGKGAAYDPYPAINAIMLCFSDKFDVIEAGLQVWLKNKEQ
jgi:predicted O-methyltransferase YrrM